MLEPPIGLSPMCPIFSKQKLRRTTAPRIPQILPSIWPKCVCSPSFPVSLYLLCIYHQIMIHWFHNRCLFVFAWMLCLDLIFFLLKPSVNRTRTRYWNQPHFKKNTVTDDCAFSSILGFPVLLSFLVTKPQRQVVNCLSICVLNTGQAPGYYTLLLNTCIGCSQHVMRSGYLSKICGWKMLFLLLYVLITAARNILSSAYFLNLYNYVRTHIGY